MERDGKREEWRREQKGRGRMAMVGSRGRLESKEKLDWVEKGDRSLLRREREGGVGCGGEEGVEKKKQYLP